MTEAIPQNLRLEALDTAYQVLGRIFDTTSYYRDQGHNLDPNNTNGLNDGYRGWYASKSSTSYTLPNLSSIEKGVTYPMRIRVRDTISVGGKRLLHVMVWVQDTVGTPAYECLHTPTDSLDPIYHPHGYSFYDGTVALLSGWSDVQFGNLHIFSVSDTGSSAILYDAAQRVSTFRRDWQFVWDGVDSGITANWNDWTIDNNGTIQCLAASHHRTDIDRPPDTGRFVGKYAALVLQPDSLGFTVSDFKNIDIRFSITINRRNIATAESGVAFRLRNPYDTDPTVGTTKHVMSAGQYKSICGGNPEYSKTFTSSGMPSCMTTAYSYFEPSAVYVAAKLRPENSLQVIRHLEHLNTDDSIITWSFQWWYAPWDEDTSCTLRPLAYPGDGLEYDGQICGTAAWFAELDSRGGAFVSAMEAADGIIPKWISVWNRNTPDWNYGCPDRRYQTFGGWKDDLVWSDYFGRFGLMLDKLSHVRGSQYADFYSSNFNYIARELIDNVMIPQHSELFPEGYLWNQERGWIGEMQDFRITNDRGFLPDVAHQGNMVRFLIDANHDGWVTREEMLPLAKTFTEIIWNHGIYKNKINVGYFIDGRLDPDSHKPSSVLCDWPLLAEYDFQVWEILDGFFNDASHWDSYVGLSPTADDAYHLFGRIAAEMLYTVRFGIPRNLRLDTLHTDCDPDGSGQHPTAFILRWDPPSDYPCGYNTGSRLMPGSRLQYYKIYRKLHADTSWAYNALDSIEIRPFQESHSSPWYFDSTAVADLEYDYYVLTQDWSAGIKNESRKSNILTVRYPADNIATVLPKTQTGLLSVRSPNLQFINRKATMHPAIYYIDSTLSIADSDTLVILPGTVLCFADSMEIECHGALIAKGGDGCDSLIEFRSARSDSGRWWGISMYPGGWHYMKKCIIQHGVNNLCLFDETGLVSSCDIRYASDNGMIIANGVENQLIEDSEIHHNHNRNVLLTTYDPNVYPDPMFTNCNIHHAELHEGVCVLSNSRAKMMGCMIRDNGGYGAYGESGGTAQLSLYQTCVFGNKEDGVRFNETDLKMQESSIIGHQIGMTLVTSYLLGWTTWNTGFGNNMLANQLVNIHAIKGSAMVFGDTLDNQSYGTHNCFFLDNPVVGINYHIFGDDDASGYAELNGYTPDSPYYFNIPPSFSIDPEDPPCDSSRFQFFPRIPVSRNPLHGCWRTAVMGDSIQIHGAVKHGIYQALQDPVYMKHAMALTRLCALRRDGGVFRRILDSISTSSFTNVALSAHLNRIPILLKYAHWREAERTLRLLLDSNYIDIASASRLNEYIAAHDASNRNAWMRNHDNSVDFYKYDPARPDAPYALGKSVEEKQSPEKSACAFTIVPNPAGSDQVTILLNTRDAATSVAIVRIHDILGRQISLKRFEPNGTDMHNLTMPINRIANGVYLVSVENGTSKSTSLLIVKR